MSCTRRGEASGQIGHKGAGVIAVTLADNVRWNQLRFGVQRNERPDIAVNARTQRVLPLRSDEAPNLILLPNIMKKKVGRPKLGTQNAKGKQLAARFTPPEMKLIQAAIAKSRSSKSDWLRKVVLSAVESGKSLS